MKFFCFLMALCNSITVYAYTIIQDSLPITPTIQELDKVLHTHDADKKVGKIQAISTHFIITTGYHNPSFIVFKKGENSIEFLEQLHEIDQGDLILNKVSLIDFNQDGWEDIFIALGDESSRETYIFLYHKKEQKFKQAYHKHSVRHSTIVDLDNNQKPELIVNSYHNQGKEMPFSPSNINQHNDAIYALYLKIAASYDIDRAPVDYLWNTLNICFPIKIIEFEAGQFVETTHRYQEHLEERIQLLKTIRSTLPQKEVEGCNQVIQYLEQYQN